MPKGTAVKRASLKTPPSVASISYDFDFLSLSDQFLELTALTRSAPLGAGASARLCRIREILVSVGGLVSTEAARRCA